MPEIEGTIQIRDGKVRSLKSISDLAFSAVHEGDLANVLPQLVADGWTLSGDYDLKVTKRVETDDERKAHLRSTSNSDTNEITEVSVKRKNS